MSSVHVTTTNNQGYTVALLLDDERDAERIAYLRGMERREELAKVEVKPAVAPAAKAAKAAPKSEPKTEN